MGSMKLFAMALAAALGVSATLASSSHSAGNGDPYKLAADTNTAGASRASGKAPGSIPGHAGAAVSGSHVNTDDKAESDGNKNPDAHKPGDGVQTEKPSGNQHGAGNTHGQGTSQSADGAAGTGGTGGVNKCENPNESITIQILEKGSSSQFACETKFKLYPSDAKKVFKEDCKTEENLKDMTRTQTSADAPPADARNQEQSAAPSIIYTLRADGKPPKKRLCYLCARETITDKNKGSKADYCTIYVESSASAQSSLVLWLSLALPWVLAVRHAT